MRQQGIFTVLTIFLLIPLLVAGQPDGIIDNYDVRLEINNGKLTERVSYFIQVNSQSGNDIGEISIYHEPSDKYKLEEAILLDKSHQIIRKVKSKDIHTEHAASRSTFFDDRLVEKFSLKHNSYPYYIKYAYSITKSEFLILDYWYPLVYNSSPTKKASLTITHPQDYEVLIDSSGQFDYSETVSEGIITQQWTKVNIEPAKTEAYASPLTESLDYIRAIPRTFVYGVPGNYYSWKEFGLWANSLNMDADILPFNRVNELKEKFSHISDQKELIKTLYYYLQDQTRYINVSLGIGGFKPYPASYVASNKYGDCKALTIYMKALLKAFDIDSYYTKVYAGVNPVKINTNFPSQQFNHIILCVPFGQDTIWLENTSNHLPFDYLGTFTQNRHVLVVNNEGGHICKTPPLAENILSNTFKLKITDSGLSGTIRSKLSNAEFEDLSYVDQNFVQKDQRDFVEKYLSKSDVLLIDYSLNKPSRDSAKIDLTAEASFNHLLRRVGPMKLVAIPALRKPSSDNFKNRINPIRFNYPQSVYDKIEITIPEGYNLDKLPDPLELTTDFGSYNCSFSQSEGVIVINRNFTLKSGEYSPSEGASIYDFFQKIESYEGNAQLVFQ